MINRAIYDQLIKKEIILVEDILTPLSETYYLMTSDKVAKWHEYNQETRHSRYPVVDQNMKIHGMVTSKDILGQDLETSIDKIMTKQPMTVNGKTSVASTAHMMVWEGIEVLPVSDDSNRLEGIISRQDVLKALQMNQRQPQVGETIDDIVTNQMVLLQGKAKGEEVYSCEVTPQMTNHLGTISYGVFTTIVSEAANRVLRSYKKGDLVVENMTIYFIKPVQMESTLEVYPKILEVGRKFGKVDVEVFNDGILVGKAMMMCQLIDRQ
jgi:predicted transcriptional regulator